MAEYSFPILEKPLSDTQWQQVAQGFGSGILAVDSEPYGIPNGGIDNAANTVRLAGRGATGEGRAVVSGFYHRYDADITLTIPAVNKTTTYHLGLTYDPTQHAATGGPIKITVTTTVPSGLGKVYLPIYTITRRANELLTDATIVDQRAFIAPSITVQGERALPPKESTLRYTVATDWLTGAQWQMDVRGAWKLIQPAAPSVIEARNTTGWSTSGGITATPLANGKTAYQVDIDVTRAGGDIPLGTDYVSMGALLPSTVRGTRGLVYSPAHVSTYAGFVAINTSTGEVLVRTADRQTTIKTNGRVNFQAGWVA